MEIDKDDYFAISKQLEKHHSIFYTFWKMGMPVFDEKVKTAEVRFNKAGEFLEYRFNPDFWNSLDNYTRTFVICHECLHIVNNHGMRVNAFRPENWEGSDLANIAMDLAVNHSLVSNFGFKRELIQGGENACWIDTVFDKDAFDKDTPVLPNKSFDYYYDLLSDMEMEISVSTLDAHNFSDINPDDLAKLAEKVADKVSEEEVDSFVRKVEAGDEECNANFIVKIQKPKKKKKWETVIQEWTMKQISTKEADQWRVVNRRYSLLDDDLILPTENETEEEEKDKTEVWFYQDVSGSCLSYVERFFKAALSIPEDKFKVRAWCFDTEIYPVNLKTGEIQGGGGTDFHILESHIQEVTKKEGKPYPKAIFVITDGYGDEIKPAKPKNWYWFLTENGYKGYLPKESKIYKLEDFE